MCQIIISLRCQRQWRVCAGRLMICLLHGDLSLEHRSVKLAWVGCRQSRDQVADSIPCPNCTLYHLLRQQMSNIHRIPVVLRPIFLMFLLVSICRLLPHLYRRFQGDRNSYGQLQSTCYHLSERACDVVRLKEKWKPNPNTILFDYFSI